MVWLQFVLIFYTEKDGKAIIVVVMHILLKHPEVHSSENLLNSKSLRQGLCLVQIQFEIRSYVCCLK